MDDISLVQQCRWLESHFTHDSITDRCLRYPKEATSIVHKAELDLFKRDKNLTLTEANKRQSLKHILAACVGQGFGQRMCRHNSHSETDPTPIATPVFNDRCRYCTRSINPTVTCAEHLIICKSLPIHSPEHICTAIENLKTQFLDFLKLFLTYWPLCIVVHLHVCLYSAYPMTGRNETLNFELCRQAEYRRRQRSCFTADLDC